MRGPSWNQWKNQRLQITTRSSAFPSVSKRASLIRQQCFFFLVRFSSCLSHQIFILTLIVLSSVPTDLKTMTERLKNRYYVTKKLFIADLQRIITNCREYNPPDSEYCKSANTLEKFFYFKLKDGGLIEKWIWQQNYLQISEQRGDFHTPRWDNIASYCHIWVNEWYVHDILQGNCWTERCLEIFDQVEHYKVSKWHYFSPLCCHFLFPSTHNGSILCISMSH